jgi:hypothetical protein
MITYDRTLQTLYRLSASTTATHDNLQRWVWVYGPFYAYTLVVWEESRLSKWKDEEVEKRRRRLGAGGLEKVVDTVSREVVGLSRVEEYVGFVEKLTESPSPVLEVVVVDENFVSSEEMEKMRRLTRVAALSKLVESLYVKVGYESGAATNSTWNRCVEAANVVVESGFAHELSFRVAVLGMDVLLGA